MRSNLLMVYAAILFVLFVPVVRASSDTCPSRIYNFCPSEKTVQWRTVTPWHIGVDTVVDQVDSDWRYAWCLKSDPPVETEFVVDWVDDLIEWSQHTVCHGFAGITTISSYPPGDWVPTKILIGSNRTLIKPNVRKPMVLEAMILEQDEREYRTEAFIALPVRKGENEIRTLNFIMSSSFVRETPGKFIYRMDYASDPTKGSSFASFIFDPEDIGNLEALKREFILGDEKRHVEFSSSQIPMNVLTSITFLDVKREKIGQIPVSLILPKE